MFHAALTYPVKNGILTEDTHILITSGVPESLRKSDSKIQLPIGLWLDDMLSIERENVECLDLEQLERLEKALASQELDIYSTCFIKASLLNAQQPSSLREWIKMGIAGKSRILKLQIIDASFFDRWAVFLFSGG